jgi:hypothetical protein
MAAVAPFTEGEVQEIREVMQDFLLGGGASDDTIAAHRRWSYLARLFFLSADKEHGSMIHLPCAGTTFDQPSKTLAVFEMMQSLFVEHLNKLAKSSTG